MKKSKMSLDKFKVQSFVTVSNTNEINTIKGGFTYATELNCPSLYCGSGGGITLMV